MTTLSEAIIYGKMERNTDELETNLRLSGKIFEALTIGLGSTTLEREVLPDGSRGNIHISTQESDGILDNSSTYRKYVLTEGTLVPDVRYGERTVSGLRKASVLAKIAFGRVNHWDAESDFHGTVVEYEDE